MSGDHIRAVRNCNPGNLDRNSANKWQGLATRKEMTPEQRAEERFCVFKSPKYGFRAMAVLLVNYQDKYSLHTISGIIHRWAPPTENNTAAYVSHVCKLTGFSAAEFLDLHTYANLAPLVKAIATHECGGWFFDDRDLDAGLRLAGVESPPPTLAKSRTMQAQGIVASATVTAGAVQQYQEMLSGLVPYLDIAKYALFAIILGSVVWTVYARWDDHRRSIR